MLMTRLADDPVQLQSTVVAIPDFQAFTVADHVLHSPEPEFRHDFPEIFCHEQHEVHHILGLAPEPLAQFLILCGNAEGTGVEVAHTHHPAAHGYQGSRGEPEFLCPEQGGYCNVPSAHQLPVCFQDHTGPKAIGRQRMMGLRQTQFPGQTGIVNGTLGCCTCPAVMPGDQNDSGAGFRHAAGNGPDTVFRYQFYGDPGLPVGVFQVVNQLGQILDGVNVVMGRGRDEGHTRCGIPGFGDPGIHFFARKVTAFAGLGSLRHFDLDLLCRHQVFTRHAKAAGCHLLDGGIALRTIPFRHFTAFTGVGFTAQTVHRNGHALVGFAGNRTIGHGTGLEPLHDLGCRLHFLQSHRLSVIHEIQTGSQVVRPGRIVHPLGIRLKGFIVTFLCGLLQQHDGLGIIEMILLAVSAPELVNADRIQGCVQPEPQGIKGMIVMIRQIGLHFLQTDPADTAYCVGEILIDHILPDARRFKYLCSLIGLQGADAHLGSRFHDSMQDRLIVVRNGFGRFLVQDIQIDQFLDAFMRQIGIDGCGTVSKQAGKFMHGPGFSGFHDDGHIRLFLCPHQVLFQGRHSKQGRNRHAGFINAAVRENQDIGSVAVGTVALEI